MSRTKSVHGLHWVGSIIFWGDRQKRKSMGSGWVRSDTRPSVTGPAASPKRWHRPFIRAETTQPVDGQTVGDRGSTYQCNLRMQLAFALQCTVPSPGRSGMERTAGGDKGEERRGEERGERTTEGETTEERGERREYRAKRREYHSTVPSKGETRCVLPPSWRR